MTTDMFNGHVLIPPNLAKLGVKRHGDGQVPDLVTIQQTPYPVLKNYRQLCLATGLEPFAGGTYEKQGDNWKTGYILSGYRDDVIEGRGDSPHMHAFALDIVTGDVHVQLVIAPVAIQFFTRVGLYPFRGFVHVDQATAEWMERFGGRRFWFQDQQRKYHSFDDLTLMMDAVRVTCGV